MQIQDLACRFIEPTITPIDLYYIYCTLNLLQIWQAGKQSTQRFITTYGHIDFLRPYFDVEPREFRNRYTISLLIFGLNMTFVH